MVHGASLSTPTRDSGPRRSIQALRCPWAEGPHRGVRRLLPGACQSARAWSAGLCLRGCAFAPRQRRPPPSLDRCGRPPETHREHVPPPEDPLWPQHLDQRTPTSSAAGWPPDPPPTTGTTEGDSRRPPTGHPSLADEVPERGRRVSGGRRWAGPRAQRGPARNPARGLVAAPVGRHVAVVSPRSLPPVGSSALTFGAWPKNKDLGGPAVQGGAAAAAPLPRMARV